MSEGKASLLPVDILLTLLTAPHYFSGRTFTLSTQVNKWKKEDRGPGLNYCLREALVLFFFQVDGVTTRTGLPPQNSRVSDIPC